MNDKQRGEWLDNDEGLYDWWKSSKQPKAKFIRENRAKIDEVIGNVTSGKKRQHYLKYG